MSLIRLNTRPSRRQLIQFGIAWVVFFLLAALFAAWRSASVPPWPMVALALIPPLIGWIFPGFLRVLFVALSVVTFPIGFVVSHLILAALYYLVLSPIGLILRVVKPGLFPKRPAPSLTTYWHPRPRTRERNDYFKPY
jgi:membrane-anchored protein YejM (alkaline phosphatase superfamily)